MIKTYSIEPNIHPITKGTLHIMLDQSERLNDVNEFCQHQILTLKELHSSVGVDINMTRAYKELRFY